MIQKTPLNLKDFIESALGAITGAWVALIFCYYFPFWPRIVFVLLIWGAAVPLATKAEKFFRKKDSKLVFFDEIVGMLIATLPIHFSSMPVTIAQILMALLIFGLVDSMKVFPANKIEHWAGGWGIVFDDVVAGLYSALIILIIYL